MTMKMQETKTWLEIRWKSLKPTLQLSQRQQSLRWHFSISAITERFFSQWSQRRKPGFSQFDCRLNKNQASIVIVRFKCFSFGFFDMHILACQELSVRVCKSWNPVYPWFNAIVEINLLNLLKWAKLLDPSNFYLFWCLFISMARWCWR